MQPSSSSPRLAHGTLLHDEEFLTSRGPACRPGQDTLCFAWKRIHDFSERPKTVLPPGLPCGGKAFIDCRNTPDGMVRHRIRIYVANQVPEGCFDAKMLRAGETPEQFLVRDNVAFVAHKAASAAASRLAATHTSSEPTSAPPPSHPAPFHPPPSAPPSHLAPPSYPPPPAPPSHPPPPAPPLQDGQAQAAAKEPEPKPKPEGSKLKFFKSKK